MDFETILFDVSDHIATITFNRPERLNATNDTSRREARRGVGHRPRRSGDPRSRSSPEPATARFRRVRTSGPPPNQGSTTRCPVRACTTACGSR